MESSRGQAASSRVAMLKECCCGCTLRTGSMIIGYISLVMASILTGIVAVSLYKAVEKDTADSFDMALEITVLVVRMLQAVTSLLLIIGTHREQRNLVLPWLILSVITVCVEGVILAMMLSQLTIGQLNARVYSMGTHVSVTIYFLFVVYSYYREINTA